MKRFIDFAFKVFPPQISNPIKAFVIIGVCLVMRSIYSNVPSFDGELSKTDQFQIFNILEASIEIGFLVSVILFLPYLLISVLRFLNPVFFESSIKDVKRVVPFYYLLVIALTSVHLLWEANYRLLLLMIALSVCSWILAYFEKVNKAIFLWTSLFVIPILMLFRVVQSI